MAQKSLGLRILWWAEVVIAARALLFFIPVLINKYLAKSFSSAVIEDRFIAVAAMTALLYLIIGIASLGENKLWRFFHYLAAALAVLGAVGLYSLMAQTQGPPAWGYFVPAIAAVIMTLSVCSRKG